MNTEHYEQIVLDTVDFERGYGSEKTWIGYCERSTDYSLEITQKIISCFLEFFDRDLSNFVTVTSLYIDKDKSVETDVLDIENELCQKGYVKSIRGNQYFDKNNQEIWEEQINKLDFSFQVFPADRDIITKFSFVSMAESSTYGQGHCFFVSEKLDLIIYPHGDNTGYGCIGIKSKDNKKGIEFLRAARNIGFNSFIEKNGKTQNIED